MDESLRRLRLGLIVGGTALISMGLFVDVRWGAMEILRFCRRATSGGER